MIILHDTYINFLANERRDKNNALRIQVSRNTREVRNLMLEALPEVTEPPICLNLGRSFLSFAASN